MNRENKIEAKTIASFSHRAHSTIKQKRLQA